jgi:hypothetical protein
MAMVGVMVPRGEASGLSLIHPDGKGDERKKRRAKWDGRDAKGPSVELEECREEENGLGAKADLIMATS